MISRTGDTQFKITQYDRQLQPAGSTAADLVNDELQVGVQASALGLTGVTGKIQGTLSHDAANDRLTLQFTAGDLQLDPVTFVRVEVLLPASPSPAPSPTASPTPTASPSPTVSPSPSASCSQPWPTSCGAGRPWSLPTGWPRCGTRIESWSSREARFERSAATRS